MVRVIVGAALVGVACGSSSPTAAVACGEYALKTCERVAACAPGVLPFFGFASAADCSAAWAADCERAAASSQIDPLCCRSGEWRRRNPRHAAGSVFHE
jgi:hypothetical protein